MKRHFEHEVCGVILKVHLFQLETAEGSSVGGKTKKRKHQQR